MLSFADMGENEGRIALFAGASGLVGAQVLEALLATSEFSRVYAVTRRGLGRDHPRLANRIVQFDRLEEQLKGTQCHTAFCCLGTSLRTAGSEQALRQVQVGYVVAFARAARAAQAQRLIVLSCAGADQKSRRPEARFAAEAEQAMEALGFGSLDILQPGAIRGLHRGGGPAELARLALMPLLDLTRVGAREPLRSVAPRLIGAAMLGAARSGRRGVYRYTCAQIHALANYKPPRRPTSSQSPAKSAQPPR